MAIYVGYNLTFVITLYILQAKIIMYTSPPCDNVFDNESTEEGICIII
jgi:hypothetical protein